MIFISDACAIKILNDASRIVIDDSRVMPHIVASLTDDSICIIYDSNIFIV